MTNTLDMATARAKFSVESAPSAETLQREISKLI